MNGGTCYNSTMGLQWVLIIQQEYINAAAFILNATTADGSATCESAASRHSRPTIIDYRINDNVLQL